MITNQELEHKGDLFPSKIVSFNQDVVSIEIDAVNILLETNYFGRK